MYLATISQLAIPAASTVMLELKGDFPQVNERIDYNNFSFEAAEVDGHRIAKVKVVVHE